MKRKTQSVCTAAEWWDLWDRDPKALTDSGEENKMWEKGNGSLIRSKPQLTSVDDLKNVKTTAVS